MRNYLEALQAEWTEKMMNVDCSEEFANVLAAGIGNIIILRKSAEDIEDYERNARANARIRDEEAA